jgi:hypothetical protein
VNKYETKSEKQFGLRLLFFVKNYLSLQVSHHPPIAATHSHNSKWEMWDEKRVSSKFGTMIMIFYCFVANLFTFIYQFFIGGNSLSMDVLGTFHLVLKSTDE